MKALVLTLTLLLACGAGAQPLSDNVRTVVVFGDTQHLVFDTPSAKYDAFAAQVDWIVANRDEQNIDFVIHPGDIIESGPFHVTKWLQTIVEWAKFLDQWQKLDAAGIQYAIVPGNHDNRGGIDLPEGWINGYFNFLGPDHFAGLGYDFVTCPYGEGDPCGPDEWGQLPIGHVWNFQLGAQPVRVAGLPWGPTQEQVDWFIDELASTPTTPAIIVAHAHLQPPQCSMRWERKLYDSLLGSGSPIVPQVMMTVMGHWQEDFKAIHRNRGYEILSVQFDRQLTPDPVKAAQVTLLRFHLDGFGKVAQVEASTTGAEPLPLAPGSMQGELPLQPFRPHDGNGDGIHDWEQCLP